MGFLDALKGGGNRDAMRQTTSLTMAYLLEQNARFEAFMRQKVDELEAIVAQQQARHAEVDPASEAVAEPEPWPEPEEGAVEPAATELVQTDTRPARPVTSYFDDFTLDDLAPAPEGAGEVFVSVAEPAGVDAPSLSDTQPLAGVTPTPESEPAPPPDWQALLLSVPSSTDEPIPEAAEMVEEPAGVGTIESAAAEGEAVEEVRTDVDTMEKGESLADEPIPEAREAVDETSSLLPTWLRRQQQAMLDPTGGEQSPEVGQETAVLAGTNAGTGDKTGESAIQETAQIATRADGVVIAEAEDEGEWDMALDKQGPAGDWE